MKIAGFTIIRNAIKNDYPIVEAICSILPVVDEMVVLVGESEDDTEHLIRSINSEKIRIHHSVWDPAHFEGGKILAVETNKALRLISPDTDWAFYIQADEVIHEKYHDVIRKAAQENLSDKKVEGLLFHYTHFYGTYDYVGDSRKWYAHEIRIIRNDPSISSYRDAQGFRKNGKKLKVKQLDAWVYHYGWVKSPKQMMIKNQNFIEFWQEEKDKKEAYKAQDIFSFESFDSLDLFKENHPTVMKERIENQNWKITLDVSKKQFSLKNRILYWIEKKTGRRLFDYQNYEIIK